MTLGHMVNEKIQSLASSAPVCFFLYLKLASQSNQVLQLTEQSNQMLESVLDFTGLLKKTQKTVHH